MPFNARRRLGDALDGLGVTRAVLRLRRSLAYPWLTIVNYHRVNDPTAAAAFDEGVLDATPATLDRQVAILKRHFTIIGIDDLSGHFRGRRLPRNPAMITFDDGYRDCHDRALPILSRHGVKAAFFIATDYVSRRRVFWWDRIAWMVKHARGGEGAIDYPRRMVLDLAPRAQARATWLLLNVVKKEVGLDLERYLAAVQAATDAPWTDDLEALFAEELLMTWDHVRSLRRAGMDVGSHTRTHRPLETLLPEALDGELRGSREDLERELGEPITSIAYPVGRPVAGIPVVRRALEAAGYELGFTYKTGVQRIRRMDRFDVARLTVDHTDGDAWFRARLALAIQQEGEPRPPD